MHEVVTIETPGLGDRSYLIHDGETAAVIDPQRDIGRVLQAAQAAGAAISHVLETHIHNDYVTGGLALARAAGAAYVVATAEEVGFSRIAARDGDEVAAGELVLTAVATPGHTPGHLSWVLREGPGDPVAVFTGGSMLFGAVGRTDLISPHQTEPLTPAPGRRVARPGRGLPDARLREFLLRDPDERQLLHHRDRTADQRRAEQRRGQLRQAADRRPGRLSPLLRAHGPRQPPRPRRT